MELAASKRDQPRRLKNDTPAVLTGGRQCPRSGSGEAALCVMAGRSLILGFVHSRSKPLRRLCVAGVVQPIPPALRGSGGGSWGARGEPFEMVPGIRSSRQHQRRSPWLLMQVKIKTSRCGEYVLAGVSPIPDAQHKSPPTTQLHLARTRGAFLYRLSIRCGAGRHPPLRSPHLTHLTHRSCLPDPQQRRARVEPMPMREVERVQIQLMPTVTAAGPARPRSAASPAPRRHPWEACAKSRLDAIQARSHAIVIIRLRQII